MRLTIVPNENVVAVEGEARKVDCSAIDPNISVIQWHDTVGHIEFVQVPGLPFRLNGKLTELGEYEAYHTAWLAAADAEPETVLPKIISDRQFFQQLAIAGVITQSEAEAAVATGTIPAAMLALVSVLPEGQQFAARMMLMGATSFERTHPLTVAFGSMYGWDDAQIDALFDAASLL
jgi:hypothetical protein